MSGPSFEVVLPPATRELIAKVQALPGKIVPAIAAAMDKATQVVMGQIVAERLTGQGPFAVEEHKLGVISNQLRGSTYATAPQISGTQITTRIGTPVAYARVHEFGFNGQVHVSSFTRKQRSRDVYAAVPRTSKKTGRPLKDGKKKVASGMAQVKDHTRWMSVPARAPFGHGIADHAPVEFPAAIGREMTATLGGQA